MNTENLAAVQPYLGFVHLFLGLFGWQDLTGVQIVQKMLSQL